MRWFRWAIPVILMAFCVPVSAQFYKYTDENGVVQFTDDLSKIPKNQREDIPAYYESKESEPETVSDIHEQSVSAQSHLSDTDATLEAKLEQESRRLEIMRKELQQEYEILVQEQARIRPGKAVTKSKARAKEYNRLKAALRERADRYEARRTDYEEAVQAYNEKVQTMNQAALSSAEE